MNTTHHHKYNSESWRTTPNDIRNLVYFNCTVNALNRKKSTMSLDRWVMWYLNIMGTEVSSKSPNLTLCPNVSHSSTRVVLIHPFKIMPVAVALMQTRHSLLRKPRELFLPVERAAGWIFNLTAALVYVLQQMLAMQFGMFREFN